MASRFVPQLLRAGLANRGRNGSPLTYFAAGRLLTDGDGARRIVVRAPFLSQEGGTRVWPSDF